MKFRRISFILRQLEKNRGPQGSYPGPAGFLGISRVPYVPFASILLCFFDLPVPNIDMPLPSNNHPIEKIVFPLKRV